MRSVAALGANWHWLLAEADMKPDLYLYVVGAGGGSSTLCWWRPRYGGSSMRVGPRAEIPDGIA